MITVQPATPETLAETTVVLNLEIGRVSNRRKVDSQSDIYQTEVDRDMLHVSKELFDSEELKECFSFQNALKAQVRAKCVPSFLRGGMYLVKIEAIETLDIMLEEAHQSFLPLVEKFAEVVDLRRDEAKERLGPAYDAGDYPNAAKVRQAFGISWRWLTLSTPSSLKRISKSFFEREAKKAEESLKAAVEDITSLLVSETAKLADHMIERLASDEDGKPKVFRNSITSNVADFLDNFSLKNIINNEQLDEQIQRVRKLMEGVDPKSLRKNDRLREDVADGFKEVRAALDTMMTSKPKRYMGGVE